VSLNKSERVSL